MSNHGQAASSAKSARLFIRVILPHGGKIGPGKVDLLEHIAASGSISQGARLMGMSYKRAWDLVEEMKVMFGEPVVSTQSGGKRGGGAEITETGQLVIDCFREIERLAGQAGAGKMAQLQAKAEKANSLPQDR